MHMPWLWHNPGPLWQWVGIAATVAGTGLSLWAALAAWAALKQARLAADVARRLARIVQIADVLADLQEMETLVARGDLKSTTAKANLMRGRIARFGVRREAYDELSEEERNELLLSQEQLTKIPLIVAGRQQVENKLAAIEIALGEIVQSVSSVAGKRLAANHKD